MKKFILGFLAIVMLFALVGCSSADKATEETTPVAGETEAPAEETAPEALKVVLLIPGNLGDKSFFDSANAGLELVKTELNAETKVIEMGFDSSNWEPTFYDAAEGDYDIIISGNDTTELLNRIASEYPEKVFMNFDTSDSTVVDNVYSMFYSTNEGSYLAGALAGLVTKSEMPLANEENIIGFLGGMDIPGINDFLVGYIEGAQSVNPDVKVLVSYAGDFGDPAKGKELTMIQYSAGSDIGFNVAGGTGLGLMDAAQEKNAYAIGVDSDQALLFKDSDPEKAEHILSSAVKRIDLAIFNAVKDYQDGTLELGTYNKMGVKEEGVLLAKNEYYSTLPQEIQDKITEIEAAISNGEIEVTSAFGLSTEEIDAIRTSVQP